MIFKNSKVYDVLRYIAEIALPALTTLYGVIGATLNIPYTQEAITIAIAVDACLGTMIGISKYQYNKSLKEVE